MSHQSMMPCNAQHPTQGLTSCHLPPGHSGWHQNTHGIHWSETEPPHPAPRVPRAKDFA